MVRNTILAQSYKKIIDCANFEEIFGAKWYKKHRLRQV